MKIDISLLSPDLTGLSTLIRRAEILDFDGLWSSEAAQDPFLPLTLAAEHSQRLSLGTAIALAFARSPTSLAYTAWDLARYSRGRFIRFFAWSRHSPNFCTLHFIAPHVRSGNITNSSSASATG